MESENEIKLEDLVGKHVFGGCEWETEDCLFMLDGVTYEMTVDKDDGWRSYLDSIKVTDKKISSLLPNKEEVLCVMYGCLKCPARSKDECICPKIPYTGYCSNGKHDCLVMLDIYSKESVLTIGTDYSDDYYPTCVFDYEPLNMACNFSERLKKVNEELEKKQQELKILYDVVIEERKEARNKIKAISEGCTETHMKDKQYKEKLDELLGYIYDSILLAYYVSTIEGYSISENDGRLFAFRDIICDNNLCEKFVYWLKHNPKIPDFLLKSRDDLIAEFEKKGNKAFTMELSNTPIKDLPLLRVSPCLVRSEQIRKIEELTKPEAEDESKNS